jgi:hypothetical protein
MRKSAVIMPLIALIAGASGYCLRRTELNTVFDSAGFAVWGKPVTLGLIALCVGVLALMTVYSVLTARAYRANEDFAAAFRTKGLIYPGVMVLSGLVWLIAAVLRYVDVRAFGRVQLLDSIFLLLLALGAVSLIVLGVIAGKGSCGREVCYISVLPSLFFCYWLVLLYKENAPNPVLLDYAYRCLAMAASALSFYYLAGYVFKKGGAGKTILSFMMTIFLCAVALADPVTPSVRLILCAALLAAFVNAVVFIGNLTKKDDPAASR